MAKWIEFREYKPNGEIHGALGMDSVLRVDARISLEAIKEIAHKHARSLWGIGKNYVQYKLLYGSSLINARAGDTVYDIVPVNPFALEDLIWNGIKYTASLEPNKDIIDPTIRFRGGIKGGDIFYHEDINMVKLGKRWQYKDEYFDTFPYAAKVAQAEAVTKFLEAETMVNAWYDSTAAGDMYASTPEYYSPN